MGKGSDTAFQTQIYPVFMQINNGGRASSVQQTRAQLSFQGTHPRRPFSHAGPARHKQSGPGWLWVNGCAENTEWAGSPWNLPQDKDTLSQERTLQVGYTRQRRGGEADTPQAIPLTWRRKIFFNHKTCLLIYMALLPTFSSKLLLCSKNNFIQQNMDII